MSLRYKKLQEEVRNINRTVLSKYNASMTLNHTWNYSPKKFHCIYTELRDSKVYRAAADVTIDEGEYDIDNDDWYTNLSVSIYEKSGTCTEQKLCPHFWSFEGTSNSVFLVVAGCMKEKCLPLDEFNNLGLNPQRYILDMDLPDIKMN